MSSGEKSDSYVTAVATQLFQTQALIQTLLTEIRENSTEQAALNAELKNLRLNVNTLSNIIRGGDGNTKPLVLEVEMMKHADIHLDKRITAVVEDIEDQILSLAKNLAESVARAEGKIEAADKSRRDWEAAKLAADTATNNAKLAADTAISNDLRLDSRTRFATKASIVIAIISMIGTILALALK